MQIITRQEAIEKGLGRYFTGRPCRLGHISEHHVHYGCLDCASLKNKQRKAKQRALEKWGCESPTEEQIKAELGRKLEKKKERIRRKNAAYRAKNKVSMNEATKAWRKLNKDRSRDLIRLWQKNNPDAVRVFKLNRRKQIKNGGKLSRTIVQKLLLLQDGKCACCRKPLGNSFHVDHIMPLALGGSNTDDNVQLLRSECNFEKRAKHPVEFMQSRGFLL